MADRRGPDPHGGRRYPRRLRVNELLREVIAEALAGVDDPRLKMATVTAVESDPDFRHAMVLLSSMTPDSLEALEEHRAELQGAIGREVRLKRTPRLSFDVDPAIESGFRVEEILRGLDTDHDGSADGDDDVRT